MDVLESVVTMKEASAMLGVSPITLRDWIRRSKLTGRNIDGRVWIFNREDIETLAAQRQRRIN